MWVHESRADLEPLRFSTHERSGVGSEKGIMGELFSLGFWARIFSATTLVLPCDFFFFSRNVLLNGRPCCRVSFNRNPDPTIPDSNRIRIACIGER